MSKKSLKKSLDPHVTLCRRLVFERKTIMKTWYIQEFGKLTKVSVRTLHHYDDIGLLQPSMRTPRGYRLYTEQDLFKLERIIALKFFGFDLKQIIELLRKDDDLLSHLQRQQTCLTEQITQLNRAQETLSALIAESQAGNEVDWSKIVTLIKVYRMTEELKKSWAAQVYSPDQLRQFAEMKTKFTEEQIKDFKQRWAVLVEKVKQNIDQGPKSAIAQQLVKEWMDLVNEQYAGFEELKDAVNMAYKHNKIPSAPFDKKLWDFLEQAAKNRQKKSGTKD